MHSLQTKLKSTLSIKHYTLRIVYCLLLLFAVLPIQAQDDPEYRMEMGGGIGVIGYLGDFNSKLTKNLQPMSTIMARYNFNPYMGLKLNASYGKIKGSSKDVKTYYPIYAEQPYTFNNQLVDVALTYEYNFWPYGTGRDYRGAQRLTPFVFGGLGFTYVKLKNSDKKNDFTANVPIGLGLKYKVTERMNLGLEWAIHLSMSDNLDGSKDPYGIKSEGMFKNTDCYHTLQLTLTYSFWAKCRTCHNQDED